MPSKNRQPFVIGSLVIFSNQTSKKNLKKLLANIFKQDDICQSAPVTKGLTLLVLGGLISGVSAKDNNYADWQYPLDTYYGYYAESPYNVDPVCTTYKYVSAPPSTGAVYYQNSASGNPSYFIAAVPINQNAAGSGQAWKGQPVDQPVVCGANGAQGDNYSSTNSPHGGKNGAMAGSISITHVNTNLNTLSGAMTVINLGGQGGKGGNGTPDGVTGAKGGWGGYGGAVTLNFVPSGQNSYYDYYTNDYGDTTIKLGFQNPYQVGYNSASFLYTPLWAQSIGGNGGDGGSHGGDGAPGGAGSTVTVNNSVAIYSSNGYGIYAQSAGGWGGRGTDANSGWYVPGGGSGGDGSAGASGGIVIVNNYANITTPNGNPIFAQSIGGNGGSGGNASGGWAGVGGGTGGDGGWGGPAQSVYVKNYSSLNGSLVGGYGIFAQSVGGGGGDAGASKGLYALGAGGGVAASGSFVEAQNYGSIFLGKNSTVGIFAQSIGGGGGAGGMAVGVVAAIGGSGGGGGNGGGVNVVNMGSIYTGNSCYMGMGADGGCLGNVYPTAPSTPITTGTNGGSFGILAQSIGGGGGSGGSGYQAGIGTLGGAALGGTGGDGGSAASVYVLNGATIQTREPNSAGILAQSIGGGGGSGGGAISITGGFTFALGVAGGGAGGTGGGGSLVGVNCLDNTAAGCTSVSSWGVGIVPNAGALINTNGVGSPGILAQSIGGGGGNGGYAIAFSGAADPGLSASTSLAFGGSAGTGGPGAAVYASPSGVQIITTGSDSPGVLAASIGGGGGSGGQSISGSISGTFSLSTSMGGSGGYGGAADSVIVSNSPYSAWFNNQSVPVAASSITTYGDRSYGLIGQSIGGGGGSGGSSISAAISSISLSQAIGGSGGGGQQAGPVTIYNSGQITTQGSAASAIVAQSIGGGGGSGGSSVGASAGILSGDFAIGGKGGKGGDGKTVYVENNSSLLTTGGNAPVIIAQSIGGGGGNGGYSSSSSINFAGKGVSIGGTGGTGAIGGEVSVLNNGAITANNATAGANPVGNNPGILAQSIGGGGGNGGYSFGSVDGAGVISVYVGGTGGAAGTASAASVWNSGQVNTQGPNSAGIIAQSIAGAGGNGGTGVTGSLSGGIGSEITLGGKGQSGGYAGSATVTSGNVISTWGHISPGIVVQSMGGSGGNGGLAVAGGVSGGGALNGSLGGDGAWAGWSGDVLASINSQITTTGDQSPAIFAQSLGGSGGNGGNSVGAGAASTASGSFSVGGDGGGGGSSGKTTVQLTGDGKNNGYIVSTNGQLSPAIVAQSIAGSGGNGGWSVAASAGGSFSGSVSIGGKGAVGGGSQAVSVTTDTKAYVWTHQDQSPGILAQSVGGTGGNGGFAAGGSASSNGAGVNVGGSGGYGGSAGGVSVSNNGLIKSEGILSPGILAQSVGGTGGNGGYSIGLGIYDTDGITINIGGDGGIGGKAATVTTLNYNSITTLKDQSTGIIAQSIGGSGGSGGLAAGGGLSGDASLSLNLGGKGGTGGQGLDVHVDNSGYITTSGNNSFGILAQSIGGSGGSGGNAIGGSISGGAALSANVGGAAGAGNVSNEVTVVSSKAISTTGDQSGAILAQSIAGSGGAGGNAINASLSDGVSGGVAVGNNGGSGGNAWDVKVQLKGVASSPYTISTTGQVSPAVVLQSIGGSGGHGGHSVSGSASFGSSASVSLGGNGGSGGAANFTEFNTSGGVNISTAGSQSAGIIAQSIGGNGGNGGAALSGSDSESTFAGSVTVGGGGGTAGQSNSVTVNLKNSDSTDAVAYGIKTDGLMSPGIVAQSISGHGGNGGNTLNGSASVNTSMTISVSGYGGDASSNLGSVTVRTESQASIVTKQDQSPGILAQSIGGSGGNGGLAFAGAFSLSGGTSTISIGGNAGSGGSASQVNIFSDSAITTSGAMSMGIIAQSIGGGGGNGGSTYSASSATDPAKGTTGTLGIGGTGGVGGVGGGVSVTQTGNITTGYCDTSKTVCDQSSGIFAQSVGGGGGNGGSTFAFALQGLKSINFNIGGAGGTGGKGGQVQVKSNQDLATGTIQTTGALSNAIFAQSVGGGGGSGGYATSVTVGYQTPVEESVELAVAVGGSGGNGGSGSAVTVSADGKLLATNGNQSAAIFAQSVGGGGGTGGSSFSFFSSKTSTATTVAGLAASYGAGKMGLSSGGDSSSSSPSLTDFTPAMSKSSSGGTAVAVSIGGAGGNGGTSGNVTVDSSSGINTNGDNSQGIFAQSVGGGGGTGGSSSSKSGSGQYVISGSIGGFGGVGGSAGDVKVNFGDSSNSSNSFITTTGLNAVAIYAQSVGGGGGSGGSSSSTASSSGYAIALGLGGFGGSGNTSGAVNVTNGAQLVTKSANSSGIYAQSVGGGGGDGGTSSASAYKANPPAADLVSGTSSWVGKLSGSTAGTASKDKGPSTAAGNNTKQQGSQAGGSSQNAAYGLSMGGFGGSGANAGAIAVNNSGTIATGSVLTTTATVTTGVSSTSTSTSSSQTVISIDPAKGATGGTNIGDYSYAIFAQSIGGGGGSGGSSSSEADTEKTSVALSIGGAGSGGGSGGSVGVTNTGSLTTNGSQAAAIFAQSVGGGGGNGGDASSSSNFLTAKSFALGLGGSAADGGTGGSINVVTSQGSITTNGAASEGIFAQSVGGGGGRGGSSATSIDLTATDAEGVVASGATSAKPGEASASTSVGIYVAAGLGGAGGNGGNGGSVNVDSSSVITTKGDSSTGIFAQSVGGGGGSAGSNTNQILYVPYSFNASLGGSGVGGNGGSVNVLSNADISTSGQSAMGIFAQSLGGGGGIMNAVNSTNTSQTGDANVIANLGSASGNNLLGGTVTLGNNNETNPRALTGLVTTQGANSVAILAQSIGSGGGVAFSSNTSPAVGGITASSTLGASGGAGGNANAIQIYSNASISTAGNNAPAMVAQSIGGGGGLVGINNVIKQIGSLSETYTLGAQSGAEGNAGAVGATLAGASIATTGANAIGFVGQSVGGGGGLLLANSASSNTSTQTAVQSIVLGGSGSSQSDGAAVNISIGNTISTGNPDKPASGPNSIAIAAQSVGGGGGIVNSTFSAGSISLNKIQIGGQSSISGSSSQTPAHSGDGGKVTVAQNGAITTQGPAAIGILAQSVGGGGGYLALASTQGNTPVSTSNVKIGGSGSNGGNGGNVRVDVNAPITTNGNNSVGVIAQSVGGGGGILLTSGLKDVIVPTFTPGAGNGGDVTVNVTQPIRMNGAGVYGVIAQSIGGGGGMAISESGVQDNSGKGGGQGGVVTVNITSSIYVDGKSTANTVITDNKDPSAYGVYAKSIGTSDPSITVAKGASIIAAGGASAIAIDGLVNNITNNGYIGISDFRFDTAVTVRGAGGNTDIKNNGVFIGKLENQGSRVSMTNAQTGRMYLTNSPNLGVGGNFVNSGYLQFSHPALSSLSSFSYRETLKQTETGLLGINFNFKESLSELIKFEKKSVEVDSLTGGNVGSNIGNSILLGGKIHPVLIKAGLIAPGSSLPTAILNKGNDVNIRDEELGVLNTAIMTYDLIKDPSKVDLTAKANFTPAGLSTFGSQLGNAIGTNQTAGSSAFFQAATAQLVTIPTVGALDQAYASLAGSAIQAMPQANYQAVTRAVGTVSDRMNSWRVGDSFIATTKNPRALMSGIASMNQPVTPNAPQVANGTLSADGGAPLTSLAKSTDARTWITPFGGSSNSNNLADQIYGGSLGIEAQSDDRTYIGGAAMTISQSNYTYSSTTTPATPGAATNYGAQFYFGARGESAYLSAIGYLGGSSGNFTRQIQTMGLSASTGVNVHSNILGARVEAGYNLLPNPQGKATLQVTPFIAIAPTQIRQNGANENFNTLGSGFYYGSNINTAVPVYLGTEISGDVVMGNNEIMKPFLRVSWAHDLMNNPMAMNGAYTTTYGPTLYANGTPSMGNMVILKGGAKYNWGTKVSAYATIDVEQGNGAYSFRGIGGSLGMMYSW